MAELIQGTVVSLGGTDYTVPPLSFKQLRKMLGKINLIGGIGGVPTDEQMNAIVEVVHSALARNYPDLTTDQVDDMLDLGNASRVVQAIMGVSGLEPGEATGSR
jgi:queuine/archaeosine tRNA-ribosyltransferase